MAPRGSFGADAVQVAPPTSTNVASTNTLLTAADVASWDAERCRTELAKLENGVREIPAQIKAAREATAAARKVATADPQHQALAEEIAKLSQQLQQKRQELLKAVDSSPAVKQAREQEETLNARLEIIHKSIAVVREQSKKQLVKKYAGKAEAAPAHNP